MTTNWFRSLRSRFNAAIGRRSGSRRGRVLSEASRNVVDALESRTMLTVSAVDDTIAVRRLDVTLAIDVLANDSATNGVPLIDGFTQPAHGTVALVAGTGGARDRLAYTPSAGYAGTDAFAYTILDGDGVPETAGVSVTLAAPAAAVDPGGPFGAGYDALSDGFVPGPFTAYTRSALGNFTFADSKSANDVSTWTDSDGIAHSVSTSGLETLVVISTQAADGNWTYVETITSSAGMTTSPASGTVGLTETLSGSYDHTFTAGGSTAGSSYTFSASDNQGGGGTSIYAWNTTAGSQGSTTTSFTQTGSFSAAVSNSYDASSDTSTGTSLLSGSGGFSSTTAGDYSYSVGTGTVCGTISGSEAYSDSYAYTESSGSYIEDGASSTAYSGTGTYGYDMDPGGVSGTIAESGGQSSTLHYTCTSDFSSGVWVDTGAGGGEFHAQSDVILSGGGTYWHTISGATLSGTVQESGEDHNSLDASWGETLADGQWLLYSGTATESASADEGSSYSGSGGYAPDLLWGVMAGTLSESGEDSWAAGQTVYWEVDEGAWTRSGSGWESASGESALSYSASGECALTISDPRSATLTGSMQESGDANSQYSYSLQQTLGSDGSWCATSGAGFAWSESHDSFNGSVSGSYVTAFGGSEIDGTMTDSASLADSSQFSMNFIVDENGNRIYSGGGWASASGQTDISYSAAGSYSRAIDSHVTDTGAFSESGTQGNSYQFSTQAVAGADGVLEFTGSGSSRDYLAEHSEYSGSGSYSSCTSSSGGAFDSTDVSFVESGVQDLSAEQLTTWVQDPGSGTWRAAETQTTQGGSASGGYGYYFGHTMSSSWATASDNGGVTTGSAGHNSSQESGQIAESYAGSYGQSMTVSIAADGSQVVSGYGGGSMEATGLANESVNWDWGNSAWCTSASQSQSSWSSGGGSYNSTDSYDYNEGWSQPSLDTPPVSWAGGTANGEQSQTSYWSSGSSSWDANNEDAGTQTTESSGTADRQGSYGESISSPRFAEHWYMGADAAGAGTANGNTSGSNQPPLWLWYAGFPFLTGPMLLGSLGGCGKVGTAGSGTITNVTRDDRWQKAVELAKQYGPADRSDLKAILEGVDTGHVTGNPAKGAQGTTTGTGPGSYTVLGMYEKFSAGDLAMEIVAEGQRRNGLLDSDKPGIAAANAILAAMEAKMIAAGIPVTKAPWQH